MKAEFAEYGDRESLRKLWQAVFFDPEWLIDEFFQTLYRNENTIVVREDGTAVSAAYLVPCTMFIGGKPYSSYYLFAAATHPDFRGRGFMAAVLEKAQETALGRGIDFTVVVPAEESLYDYYGKAGYENAFFKRVVKFSRNELAALEKKPEFPESFITDVLSVRRLCLEEHDRLEFDRDSITFAMDSHDAATGYEAFTSEGYALYNIGKNTAFVREIFCLTDYRELYSMLLAECNAENFTFEVPVFSPVRSEEDRIVPAGMCLPLTDGAKEAFAGIRDAYIGITP